MYKQLYVNDGERQALATIRRYGAADFDQLIRVQQLSFPPPFPSELWWNKEQLTQHVTLFPEGALCVEIDGGIVGSMTSLLVRYDNGRSDHSWEAVTDRGYITASHDPNGDTLYVVDICVAPAYRKYGLGKWLMQSMYETVVHLGLSRLLGGGRMPGYSRVSAEMTAEQYLSEVVAGIRKDPVITFLLRCGRTPVGVVENYLEDEESCHFGALMEWRNPFQRSVE